MMSLDWKNEDSLEMIRQYRSHPVLWNKSHSYYYSKVRKNKAWLTIATNMGVGVDEVRQKMNSLLGSFRRERCKVRRGGRRGHSDYISKWFAFSHMQFLMNRNENIPDNSTDLDESLVKNEEDDEEEEDLAMDSDSNHLLEEELNEASVISDSIQSPPSKRRKTRDFNTPSEDTLNVVPITIDNNDECLIFGQYVISKMRKFSDRTRAFVERAIQNVLFEADLGKFDDLASPFDVRHQTVSMEYLNPSLDEENVHLDTKNLLKPVQSSVVSNEIDETDI